MFLFFLTWCKYISKKGGRYLLRKLPFRRSHNKQVYYSVKKKYKHIVSESHSVVSNVCKIMDCNLPGSSVHRILQAKYWSGLPFPSSVDLPNPGTEPMASALQADSLLLSHQESPEKSVWIK